MVLQASCRRDLAPKAPRLGTLGLRLSPAAPAQSVLRWSCLLTDVSCLGRLFFALLTSLALTFFHFLRPGTLHLRGTPVTTKKPNMTSPEDSVVCSASHSGPKPTPHHRASALNLGPPESSLGLRHRSAPDPRQIRARSAPVLADMTSGRSG